MHGTSLSGHKANRLNHCTRYLMMAAATAAVLQSRIGSAATFTYTPVNNAGPDLWSTNPPTNWNAVPISNTSTDLVFVGTNTTILATGLTNTNTDDIPGAFSLGQLDLQGTGPASGSDTININYSTGAGSTGLSLVNNGNINLSALTGAGSGLIYNVNVPITFAGTAFFNGSGSAIFNFNAPFIGGGNTTKQAGSSTIVIGAVSNLSGTFLIKGGTLRYSGAGNTLGGSEAIKFQNNGDVLDLNGTNQTIAALDEALGTETGIIENNGSVPSTLTVPAGYKTISVSLVDNTNSGIGTLALTKTSNNTLNLIGANTYSGLTTISGGTLQIGNAGTTGTLGSGTVTNNATLKFNRTDTLTVNNAISGSGAVTQAGSGTLILGGSNSFTGATNVSTGTLQLANASALGTANNGTTVTSGATLDLNGQSIGSEPLTLSGTGIGANGALINNNTASAANDTGGVNIGTATTFSVGGAGNITLSGQLGSYPNANTITKVGAGTLTISGGTGTDNYALALVANSGTVVLAKSSSSGIHSVGGGITIAGGLVQLGGTGGDQIYDGDTVTVTSGAFDTNGLNESFNQSSGILSLAGTGISNGGALINSAAAASTLTPYSTTLTADTTIGVTQAAGSLYLNGPISGGFALTKVGAGTLTLSGTNTYTGATIVNAGVLAAVSTQAFGVNSAVSLANIAGVAIDISLNNNSIGSLTGGGSTGGNVILGVNVLTIGGDNTSPAPYAGTISGTGSIVKNGTGTLTLSGTSSYTGYTNINSGILNIQNGSALGTSTISTVSVANGATLQLQGGITTVAEPLQIAGPGATGQNGALVNVSGANTYSGMVTVGGSGAGNTIISSDGGSLTLGGGYLNYSNVVTLTGSGIGTISGSSVTLTTSNAALIKTGSGTWNLASPATFTGSLQLKAGMVNFVGGGLGTGTINFLGGILQYAPGNTEDISNRIIYSNSSSPLGVVAIDTNGNNVTFAQPVDSTNSKGLNKLGNGTLTLNAANAYGGNTTITAGTLEVGSAGALPISTQLTVGDGTNAALAQFDNATLGSLHTVTVAGINVQNNSALNVISPVNPTSAADRTNHTVLVTNSLALAGTATVDMAGNDLVVHNANPTAAAATLAQVTAALTTGYNTGGAYWGGTGIRSSAAATDSTYLTTLGVADGLTSFNGSAVSANDVLVKYTYYGDADLSGSVDGTDYSKIDFAFAGNVANPGTYGGWSNGDFNYDGKIDGSDYTLIDNAFNLQGTNGLASTMSMVAANTSEIAPSPSGAVPEPTSLGLLAVGALGMLSRRRRK